MNLKELQTFCQDNGESAFRGSQLYEWMYRHGVDTIEEMSNLSQSFREKLSENCSIQTLHVDRTNPSQIDQSVKLLFRTLDQQFIETVSMVDGNRHTVCLSSQVGCALDCRFCATGEMGLTRNLTTGEIVDQLIYVRKHIAQPITNVVFMGMGEPFHNYENVLNAADIFHDPKGFNLASTRITISTVGLLPQIQQFIQENRRYKLAISLNAAFDKDRSKIMPVNKKWPIEDLIHAGREYSNQKKRQVMFEYVLLKGVNDSEEDALELAGLLKNVECKINVIPYNEMGGEFTRPDTQTIEKFVNVLHKHRRGYRVLVRWSKGQDIAAGCGQLAGQTA
ncbi:MAG: 23S rRNA (adenine(2503)-C(2))-methyltransferase RlmN [Candidatus Marinimicrobia bacterium]|jgi:23S rRNA (adenine2503-C2)-methyltransferase|nr:23S rRNA (adenine(2503)-C(2))-methyltransferase RlmN [Candidatus Neomarinimicrobiota bacterium]MDP6852976.1 23S rRNA (adenine(2503)-C(2))-methyltransferase RlmN [Candidatus Neomarinimicrobiota bacterium]MDP6936629.1 23S rRNA (adenine(2503)-C(2))-methyltransferase RlmN [Candidatus Neomarinimicrobiota bacterium]